MGWRSIQFDWNQARAFLVTAEEGSLSAAAKELGLTQPTLGRQVSGLEQKLGVRLFDRMGAGLVLTPTGIELLEHVRKMGEAANALSLSATGLSSQLEGAVCISATEVMSFSGLPPILKLLRQQYPGIKVELQVSNETQDLNRREADIAIRSYRPTQPDLIAKKSLTFRGISTPMLTIGRRLLSNMVMMRFSMLTLSVFLIHLIMPSCWSRDLTSRLRSLKFLILPPII